MEPLGNTIFDAEEEVMSLPAPVVCFAPFDCPENGVLVELRAVDVHALLDRELEGEEGAERLVGAVHGLEVGKLQAGLERPLSTYTQYRHSQHE